MTKKQQTLKTIAKHLKSSGLPISASNRSSTRYIGFGAVSIRVSDHELGVADYGSRIQKHKGGPDIVISAEKSIVEIVEEIIYEFRQYICDYFAWKSDEDRFDAAKTLCGLRAAYKKLAK